MPRHAVGLPPALASRPLRLLRPRDAKTVYPSNPSVELARLSERGLLQRVAAGYYAVVPADRVGDALWRPPLVATAWAIAAADYGTDKVAVCGPSAARHHGLIPRELAVAFVAVPKQRPRLELLGGEARFVRREVERLDLERADFTLGQGWVTTLEQTMLDLAASPRRWMLSSADFEEVVRAAMPRLDRELLLQLGETQRRRATAVRVLARATPS